MNKSTKNDLGTLDEIALRNVEGVQGVDTFTHDSVPYVLLSHQYRGSSVLSVFDARMISENSDPANVVHVPSLSEKGSILGRVRCDQSFQWSDGSRGAFVVARHHVAGLGAYGVVQWDYGFLAGKISELFDTNNPVQWKNISVGSYRISDFDILQRDGRIYFCQNNVLHSCSLNDDEEPAVFKVGANKQDVPAEFIANNGTVLYARWYDFSQFKSVGFVIDTVEKKICEKQREIMTARSFRCQDRYLFVEDWKSNGESRFKGRSNDESRSIHVFRESSPEDRILFDVGTFSLRGTFPPVSPNAQLRGTLYTEIAYSPETETLFAVAGYDVLKGRFVAGKD